MKLGGQQRVGLLKARSLGPFYDQPVPPPAHPASISTYSFDVVSDFDRQELVNTLDQVRRDVVQRYDLKDSATEIDPRGDQ